MARDETTSDTSKAEAVPQATTNEVQNTILQSSKVEVVRQIHNSMHNTEHYHTYAIMVGST